MHSDRFAWRKSSYSTSQGGQCIEVAATPEFVGIRDTKNRALGHLAMSPQAWSAFIRSGLVAES